MVGLIQQARIGDLSKIVKVHIEAFPDFFMTKLGSQFLYQYYKTVLLHNKGILLIYKFDEEIIGFVSGFAEPEAFYKLLKKRKLVLGLTIIIPVIKNPSLIKRLMATYQLTDNKQESDTTGSCELSSLAVVPKGSGHGIGQKLVTSFLEEARIYGCENVYLHTDASENDRVNIFYSYLGFKLCRTFIAPIDRQMNEYRYSVHNNSC